MLVFVLELVSLQMWAMMCTLAKDASTLFRCKVKSERWFHSLCVHLLSLATAASSLVENSTGARVAGAGTWSRCQVQAVVCAVAVPESQPDHQVVFICCLCAVAWSKEVCAHTGTCVLVTAAFALVRGRVESKLAPFPLNMLTLLW